MVCTRGRSRLAMSDDRAGPRVAAVLDGVALQNACGALEVQGDPGGVIYLDKGTITYAQSDWTPDLAARLLGTVRPAAGLRELVASDHQPSGNLGALLIEHGHVTADELTKVLHSVIVDAIIALTVPLADEAFVAGLRLVSGRKHWAADFTRFAIGAVRAEAVSRAERMAACPVPRRAPVELCDLAGGSVVLTGEQWAIASEMTGTFSAKDLARAAGFSMYETVSYVDDLVEAGLCTPCQPGESASGQRPATASSVPAAASSVRAAASSVPAAVSELPVGPPSRRDAGSSPAALPTAGSSPAALPTAGSSTGAQPMPRRKPGEAAAALAAAARAQAVGVVGAQAAEAEVEAGFDDADATMVLPAVGSPVAVSGPDDASGPNDGIGRGHANGRGEANGLAHANGRDDANGRGHANGRGEASGLAHANGRGEANGLAHANGLAYANGRVGSSRHIDAGGLGYANGRIDARGRVDAGGSRDAGGRAEAVPLLIPPEFTPVPFDSLQRVLEGLRRLS
jgi:hypothetical protein